MPKQRIFVAMSTYNGERFLLEQLQSIAEQSRLPDKLVVIDDCSKDSTLKILHDFAARASFEVEIVPNSENIGYIRSFDRAITLCDCDIIVLADQDDEWYLAKLEKIEAAFEEDQDLSMVFSDAEIVDEDMRSLGYTRWAVECFTHKEQTLVKEGLALKVLLKHITVLNGCTMAFAGREKRRILPVPYSWSHDAWIAMITAVYGKVGLISEPLVRYRQHSRNVAGTIQKSFAQKQSIARNSRAEFYNAEFKRYELLLERLSSSEPVAQERLQLIEDKAKHLCVRANLPVCRLKRVTPVFRELITLRYMRYSRGMLSCLLDMVG